MVIRRAAITLSIFLLLFSSNVPFAGEKEEYRAIDIIIENLEESPEKEIIILLKNMVDARDKEIKALESLLDEYRAKIEEKEKIINLLEKQKENLRKIEKELQKRVDILEALLKNQKLG